MAARRCDEVEAYRAVVMGHLLRVSPQAVPFAVLVELLQLPAYPNARARDFTSADRVKFAEAAQARRKLDQALQSLRQGRFIRRVAAGWEVADTQAALDLLAPSVGLH